MDDTDDGPELEQIADAPEEMWEPEEEAVNEGPVSIKKPRKKKRGGVQDISIDMLENEDGSIQLDNKILGRKNYVSPIQVQKMAPQRGHVNKVRRMGPDGKFLPVERDET